MRQRSSAVILLLTIIAISIIMYEMKDPGKKSKTFPKKQNEKWVVLVHGVMRSPSSMSKIEKALITEGYYTLNFGYSGRNETVKSISRRLHGDISKINGRDVESISFVTHSYGTIIVRHYLAHHNVRKLGRFVMIAPPNKGSEMGRMIIKIPLARWILGIAGEKVKDVDRSVPLIIKPPPCEFAVITGGTGYKFGINPLLSGDNDGTVTVDESRLEGMKDYIQIKGQHSILLLKKSVIDNIISFLKNGSFIKFKQ